MFYQSPVVEQGVVLAQENEHIYPQVQKIFGKDGKDSLCVL